MAGFFGGKDKYTRPGPGISKSEAEKTGLSRYFDILGRRIWKIITVNFIYFLFSIIPLMLMAMVCNVSITWTASTVMSSEELREWINNGGTMAVAIAALLIYANCGGGPAACGLINVLRKYVSDTHAWAWQDFWDGFKTNLKYGIVAYIIDLFAALVLILNFGYYNSQQGLVSALLLGLVVLVAFLWSMMHVYIYPIMTSFELRLRDVYKNSFIMVIAKLPQTLGAFVLGFMFSFAVIAFGAATPYLMFLIPVILFGLCEYTRLSIVYPLMVKYMADPAGKADTFGEAVFNDDREH
ncbi:MAG: hypothetical protein J1F63_00560 [Oscillospiraceae bacterium]|nr:hypothetical protein [Oscillospiraceae bacterium]